MRELLPFRLGVGFAFIIGATLAFVPLLSVHGVESALALGLLLPPWAAAVAAAYVVGHGEVRGLDTILRTAGAGLLLWAIPTLLLGLNAFRVRQCAPGEGLAFMLLGPALGCVLASCAGVWVGAVTRNPRRAPWLAAMVPVGASVLGLWAFYATPTVYVFGAFAGYFPGAIYDDLIQLPSRYLTYRGSILLAVVGLAVLFDAWWDPESGELAARRRSRSRAGTVAVALTALLVVGASYWHGDRLGHWVSEDHVVETLGKTERGRHCVVHMPRETRPDDAARLVEDCDFNVARTIALTGVRPTEPITAYFFRNRSEKKDLIGVGRTLIAKPWRHEVYLQMARWPHPVLGHEVVHAVLADAGRAPFAVAATWGGLVPNPGLVEGAAVAFNWDLRDELDPDQWSRIMLDRGELPPATALMSVTFTSLPAIRAYMAAGSLVRFLVERRGMEALLHAYGDGEVEGLGDLEDEWHTALSKVSVTPRERGIAEVALAQKSIFGTVCPHALAKLRADLQNDAAARDDARMRATCEAILDIDAREAQARAVLVGALARSGDQEGALGELDTLREELDAPKPIVAAALEAYADASWTGGRYDEAKALYDELLALPRTDGATRLSEVKRLGIGADPTARALLHRVFIGEPSSATAVHIGQELAEKRADGLGPYLEARQLMSQRQYDLALPLLLEAKARGLPTERLGRELDRMLGVTTFALGSFDDSAALWNAHSWRSGAAGAVALRWLERIEYAKTGAVSPKR